MEQSELNILYLKENGELEKLDKTQSNIYTRYFNQFTHFSSIVFVPSVNILMTQIFIPQLNLKQTKSNYSELLLYAIENQLAEDIEEVDLVLFDADKKKGVYTVGIFNRSLLEEWFNVLEAQNYLPAIVLPDIFMLPFSGNNTWNVYFTEKMVVVRTGKYDGFAVEKENFHLYLESALEPRNLIESSSSHQTDKPILLKLYNTQNNTLDLSRYSQIGLQFQEENQNCQWWELAAQENHQLPEFNLLEQHPENAQFSRSRRLKKWKNAFILLGALFVVLLMSGLSEYIYLNKENKTVQQAIKNIYFKLYPQASEMVSPRARMEQDLKFTKNQKDSFWSGYMRMGTALEKEPKASLKSLRYENAKFQLTIGANSVATLEELNKAFRNSGLTISGVNIVSTGQEVSETLVLGVK